MQMILEFNKKKIIFSKNSRNFSHILNWQYQLKSVQEIYTQNSKLFQTLKSLLHQSIRQLLEVNFALLVNSFCVFQLYIKKRKRVILHQSQKEYQIHFQVLDLQG
ncbi:unnamed protein product [Paramecium octaurelia]|uniref:Uncharacterized protein n=1 Tax=Paramecium octaurelia TaxID=43137 RepID=A0A8S1UXT8_PAROT|nr:unnamed protein product [Paramecium octaurelia]